MILQNSKDCQIECKPKQIPFLNCTPDKAILHGACAVI
nr:MAG TPA: hypothetical protein [Caudoviricetes sp.]